MWGVNQSGSSHPHNAFHLENIFHLSFVVLQVLEETCLELFDNTLGVSYYQSVAIHPRTGVDFLTMETITFPNDFSPSEKHINFYTTISTYFSFSFGFRRKTKEKLDAMRNGVLRCEILKKAYQIGMNKAKHLFWKC